MQLRKTSYQFNICGNVNANTLLDPAVRQHVTRAASASTPCELTHATPCSPLFLQCQGGSPAPAFQLDETSSPKLCYNLGRNLNALYVRSPPYAHNVSLVSEPSLGFDLIYTGGSTDFCNGQPRSFAIRFLCGDEPFPLVRPPASSAPTSAGVL
jgi:hypothetical protein